MQNRRCFYVPVAVVVVVAVGQLAIGEEIYIFPERAWARATVIMEITCGLIATTHKSIGKRDASGMHVCICVRAEIVLRLMTLHLCT